MLPGTLAYVLEDDVGVCGYVLAALDSKPFYALLQSEWLPKAAAMYPQPDEACMCTWIHIHICSMIVILLFWPLHLFTH